MKVLLIIDMLNDFCPGGALPVDEGDKIVPIINNLIDRGDFDQIIGVNDAHPAGHISFASSHPGRSNYETININGLKQTLWPDHCVPGSWGSQFHPNLKSSKIDKVILKGINKDVDSYSAFFDNAKLNQTELKDYLLEQCLSRRINPDQINLYICGLALDYCVKYTAFDSRELGYNTTVLFDATRAVNLLPYDEMKALHELEEKGVQISISTKIIKEERELTKGYKVENRIPV